MDRDGRFWKDILTFRILPGGFLFLFFIFCIVRIFCQGGWVMYKVGIIGTGAVGSALALILKSKGYELTGVCSKNGNSSAQLALITGAKNCQDPAEVLEKAEVVFLATPDRAIAEVAGVLSESSLVRKSQIFFHLSGALPASVLSPLKKFGALIASMHPLQSFAEAERAISQLKGVFYGVQGDSEAVGVAFEIIEDLNGNPYLIKNEDKALYHLAACTASNYMVSLIHCAVGLFEKLGMDSDQALRALFPLVKGTLNNIESLGPVRALTGPVARGDTQTLDHHLKVLRSSRRTVSRLYRVMGEYTCQVALEKQSIDAIKANEIINLFHREDEDDGSQ